MKIEEQPSLAQRQKAQRFAGKWHNQHNSEIDLCIDDDGSVSGTFTTTIKGSGKRESFPLRGFASNDVIAFSVGFPRYGSVTSWSGQIANIAEDGELKNTLQTLWHMALDLGDKADTDLWRGTLSGSDIFRVGAADEESVIETMLPPSHPWWI